MALFEEERTLDQVALRVAELEQALAVLAEHPKVAAVRQWGLMVGVDLQKDPGCPYPSALRTGDRLCAMLRAYGVILRPLGDTIVLMPPLCIRQAQLARLVQVLGLGLDALLAED